MNPVTTTETHNQKLIEGLITLAGSPSHSPYVERVPVRLTDPFEGNTVIDLQTWIFQASAGNVLSISPLSTALDPSAFQQDIVKSGFYDDSTLQLIANMAVKHGLQPSESVDVGLAATDLIARDPSCLEAATAFRSDYLSTFSEFHKEEDPDPISVRLIELANLLKTNGFKP